MYTGKVGERLIRKTRNLIPSGSSVRIRPLSFLFAFLNIFISILHGVSRSFTNNEICPP